MHPSCSATVRERNDISLKCIRFALRVPGDSLTDDLATYLTVILTRDLAQPLFKHLATDLVEITLQFVTIVTMDDTAFSSKYGTQSTPWLSPITLQSSTNNDNTLSCLLCLIENVCNALGVVPERIKPR